MVGSGGAGADLGQIVCEQPVSAQIPATLQGESGEYAVAIMATIGAGALTGYLYSIMFNPFDTPNFVITPTACWPSCVPKRSGLRVNESSNYRVRESRHISLDDRRGNTACAAAPPEDARPQAPRPVQAASRHRTPTRQALSALAS